MNNLNIKNNNLINSLNEIIYNWLFKKLNFFFKLNF
jgi:hypothetical protein